MPKLIQISDCHIDDQALAMEADTQANLKKIIAQISSQKFDALLISGDLTHQGTAPSYNRLKQILAPIDAPIYVIGGNHDNITQLEKTFKQNTFNSFKLKNWEIVSIDSVQLDKTSGRVTQGALLKLDQTLEASNADHIMVVLHHPIVPMNSTWDDALSLENPQDLFKVLDKHSKIRIVVFGHAHEAAHFSNKQFDIVSCPSTALQYNQETRIGFNEFNLQNGGNINWQTQWI
ncbi:metallophosphoesterase family protein [Candidatus Thioglobus sp.]|uniref:metallophosphoesterase family protein n=1 Tax=Candidatus Thioglobus sp. TaxID=2026721 RepID=UPI003D0AFAED